MCVVSSEDFHEVGFEKFWHTHQPTTPRAPRPGRVQLQSRKVQAAMARRTSIFEGFINGIESMTGVDVDGDGDIGRPGQEDAEDAVVTPEGMVDISVGDAEVPTRPVLGGRGLSVELEERLSATRSKIAAVEAERSLQEEELLTQHQQPVAESNAAAAETGPPWVPPISGVDDPVQRRLAIILDREAGFSKRAASKQRLVAELEATVAHERELVQRLERQYVQPPPSGEPRPSSPPPAIDPLPVIRVPRVKAPLPRASRGVLASGATGSSWSVSRGGGVPESSDALGQLFAANCKLKLRVGAELDTDDAGSLPAGVRVLIVERVELDNGTQRALVQREGEAKPSGWVSCLAKDGRDTLDMWTPPPNVTSLAFQDTTYIRRHGPPGRLIQQAIVEARKGQRDGLKAHALMQQGSFLG